MTTLQELAQREMDRYNTVIAAERAFIDEAESRAVNGSWTAEDQTKFEAFAAEATAARARVDQYIARAEAERADAELAERVQRAAVPRGGGTGAGQPGGDADARQVLNSQIRAALLGHDADGNAVSIRALDVDSVGFPLQAWASRSTLVGSGGNANGLVPTTMLGQLYELMVERSTLFQLGCRVITTSGGEPLEWPKKTSRKAASSIVPEATAIPVTDPTFGKVTFGAFKYGDMSLISSEALEDPVVDLVPILLEDSVDVMADTFGAHCIATGNGTTQPQAILTSASVGKTGATGVAGAFTFDDLLELEYSVIAPYRRDASTHWLMSDQAALVARKIKDGDGNYVWQPAVTVGQPDRLFGYRVAIDPNMPTPGTAKRSVLFGAFRAYAIRQVRQMTVKRSDDYKFAEDMIAYRLTYRADGRMVDTSGAIKAFVGGAS